MEDAKKVPLLGSGGPDPIFYTAGTSLEHVKGCSALKVFDLAPEAKPTTCEVLLDPGKTFEVSVEDVDGKPVKEAAVAGLDADPNRAAVAVLPEAHCTVHALDPKDGPRQVTFYHTGRKIAGTLPLKGDEKVPPVVTLLPLGAVTGRVFDPDGKPLAGTQVRLNYDSFAAQTLVRRLGVGNEVKADKDGRFRIEGVIPGVQFDLYVPDSPSLLAANRRVKGGEALELGEVKLKKAD